MKPNKRARYAAAITLSKGKMYEFGVPEEYHLSLPDNIDLEDQFPFAIGTLGDFAAETVLRWLDKGRSGRVTSREEIIFAAQIFQAYDESNLNPSLSHELRLLSAAAYYLGDVPGSSLVQIQRLAGVSLEEKDVLNVAVRIALGSPWLKSTAIARVSRVSRVSVLLSKLRAHFLTGAEEGLYEAVVGLRKWAYESGNAHELLFSDILIAIIIVRLRRSGWTLLPQYSGLSVEAWQTYLSRPESIKEMWSSQRMLGEANIYRGASGVVQMPTSVGKTRATELILRAAFIAGRTRLAVIVAPFRALCHEIAQDLQRAFVNDSYGVNKVSDALQLDLGVDFPLFFNDEVLSVSHVIVLTPEKLLYILRQEPMMVNHIGLILFDEGHQFDVGARGVAYELLLTSIKSLLQVDAQIVLISAVIENAEDVAKRAQVIRNDWLQTRRLIGFAGLPPGKEGQLHFNVGDENEQKFYVPRVIVKEVLKSRLRETKQRIFPDGSSNSIALYLSLLLVPKGGVAIYVRTKVSAAKLVRDAAEEVFDRDVSLAAPLESSNQEQVQKFVNLFSANFGEKSYLTKAAKLGMFLHHGSTPHGVRLAIEYAMRMQHIKFIVCTSTLAQGVNLPIKYLLVTSPMQGADKIRPRDFHNLMGRAGRAGMYGEGVIIFTDPEVYDERQFQKRRWESVLNLLNPVHSTSIRSTLLGLSFPLMSDDGSEFLDAFEPLEIAISLIDGAKEIYQRVELFARRSSRKFSLESLNKQLDTRRAAIEAIESFLMTYMCERTGDSFVTIAAELAQETLAFSIAERERQLILMEVFKRIAGRIEEVVPNAETQARYGRTLLGLNAALSIDNWVQNKIFELSLVESDDDLLPVIWPLLVDLSEDRRIKKSTPANAMRVLMNGWLAGISFENLLADLEALGARSPYGKSGQKFTIDIVVDVCEQAFGFEFAHFLPAISAAFDAAGVAQQTSVEFQGYAELLQKRFKYGLPTQGAIAFFESGFSDRVVSQLLAEDDISKGVDSLLKVRAAVKKNLDRAKDIVMKFPEYFENVLLGIAG